MAEYSEVVAGGAFPLKRPRKQKNTSFFAALACHCLLDVPLLSLDLPLPFLGPFTALSATYHCPFSALPLPS